MMSEKLWLCLIFPFVFFGNSRIAAQNWNPNSTTTRAYKSSQAVFSARVDGVASGERLSPKMRVRYSSSDDSGKFIPIVTVRKMYKRADAFAIAEGDNLTIYPNGNGCQNVYAAGEDWLFYANYDEGNFAWVVSDCYRTKPLKDAADDLKFFENLPFALDKPRISGKISRLILPATENRRAVYQPLENVEVSIEIVDYQKNPEERKIFKLKADERGVYEMYDPPQGSIYIRPAVRFENVKIETEAMGNDNYFRNQKNFAFGDNFTIIVSPPPAVVKGKVTDENDKPVRNIKVELIPAANKRWVELLTAYTDDAGDYRFEIPELEGDFKFIVAANDEPFRSPQKPYRTAFYPNAANENSARTVDLKSGQTVENVDIKFGAPLKDKTISGKAFFRNGVPVAVGSVTFDGTITSRRENYSDFYRDYYFPANAPVKDGAFSLTAIESADGIIKAELFFKRSVLEKCLNRKLDLPDDQQIVYVRSKPQRIVIDGDVKDVALKFLIPPCEPLGEPPVEANERGNRPANGAGESARYGRQIRYAYSNNQPPEKTQPPAFYDTKAPGSVYENSTLIVEGTVENLVFNDAADSLKIAEKYPYDYRELMQIKVEKLYKPGDIFGIEVGDSLLLRDYRNIERKIGERRIFFLNPNQDRTYNFSPNRSENIWVPNGSVPSVDLKSKAFLKILDAPQKRFTKRISGYVRLIKRRYKDSDDGKRADSTSEPVGDFRVVLMSPNGGTIAGEKYLTAVTDADGFYEFDDLPAGEFWIYASSPKYSAMQGEEKFGHIEFDDKRIGNLVDLTKQNEAGIDFEVDYRGVIKGKVTDEKGNPVEFASVKLLDYATLREPLTVRQQSYTVENGEYSLRGIPPGKYAVAVVAPPFQVNLAADYATTYFPGVAERAKAVRVEITEAPVTKIIDIKVSQHIGRKTISGTVNFLENVKPPGEVFVAYDGAFDFARFPSRSVNGSYEIRQKFSETTIENGRFSLSVPENTSGTLRAYTFLTAEKAAGCLAGQGLPVPEADGSVKVYSTAAEVSVKNNVENIKLRFRVPPACF